MKPSRIIIDVESTSTCDIRLGAAAYWSHPDTQVICVAYQLDDSPALVWRPGFNWVPGPWTRDVRIVAHNYLFEWHCWDKVLGPVHGWPTVSRSQFDCTMARALYWGLPASLENVTAALDLPVKKDKEGHALMKRMARPRSLNPLTWWHETDPVKLDRLINYCVEDVKAEACLDDALPPLPDRERAIFELDGDINLTGLRIDRKTVSMLRRITDQETARLNDEMRRCTSGRVQTTNQVGAILNEVPIQSLGIQSLRKDDIRELLNNRPMIPAARNLLEIRLEASKASTKKLVMMEDSASQDDDRCRGGFQYYGASTGRWAGRIVQPQNMPRDGFEHPQSVIDILEHGASAEAVLLLTGRSVMDTVSALLRSCFVPSPGRVFISGDLSQIEARVVAWIAGQQDILDVFAERKIDPYIYTAGKIGSTSRMLGKVLVLACGFGMGPERFRDTAKTYGVHLSAVEAEEAVRGWRAANLNIVRLWYALGNAAVRVAQAAHGYEERVGEFLTLRKTRRAMRIRLPSGRELLYQNIECSPEGELSYMGVKMKKWERIRTYGGKLAENVTQAIARDVMAETLLYTTGLMVVGTVHDELLAEVPKDLGEQHLQGLLKVMRRTPVWAPGLPVWAEGWTGDRYKKA